VGNALFGGELLHGGVVKFAAEVRQSNAVVSARSVLIDRRAGATRIVLLNGNKGRRSIG
jgi:hypothetical protein